MSAVIYILPAAAFAAAVFGPVTLGYITRRGALRDRKQDKVRRDADHNELIKEFAELRGLLVNLTSEVCVMADPTRFSPPAADPEHETLTAPLSPAKDDPDALTPDKKEEGEGVNDG
jgi:hypothetical protein